MFEEINKVIEGGYCTGCGACAFVAKGKMKINDYGEYAPDLNSFNRDQRASSTASFVCPSLNPDYNEDILAEQFLDKHQKDSAYIGPYTAVYGGYVAEGTYRDQGTSGGLGTWVGAELFRQNMIDAVIHIKEHKRSEVMDPFFKYGASRSLEEIHYGSRTKYHVVEMSEVLTFIQNNPARYLFIGLPCMIKTIRRLQLKNEVLKESIKFTMALVCGHLKTINWTLSLAWGKGLQPANLDRFRYRTKGPSIPARAYFFTAFGKPNTKHSEILANSSDVVGGKFNQGALMLPACNFCDDLVGETADITIGDAWLPQFEVDQKGTNLVIIRNRELDKLLNNAKSETRVFLTALSEKDVIDAQSGGFRQRKEGLSYRLKQQQKAGGWMPVKRIKPGSYKIAPLRKVIYSLRVRVTKNSRELFKIALRKNDFGLYQKKMQSLIKFLRMLEIASSSGRIMRKEFYYLRVRIFGKK